MASDVPYNAEVPELIAHMDELVGQLRGHVPLALREFEEEAIHKARVATRRLTASLEVFEPLVPEGDGRDFRRALRKLRRRLGPHRDLDVLIAHVEELASDEQHATAGTFLARALREQRDALRQKTTAKGKINRTLSRLDSYVSVRAELLEHPEAYGPLVAEGVHAGLEEFSALADLLAHGLIEPSVPAGGDAAGDLGSLGAAAGSAIDPHEVRIAGKHLRYALELAEAMGVAGVGGGLKIFKELQDALGLWHDHVVLAETALAEVRERSLTHRDSALAGAVLASAGTSLGRASGYLKEFASLWEQRGGMLVSAVRSALPLTRAASQSKPHPAEWPAGPGRRPGKPGTDRDRRRRGKPDESGGTPVAGAKRSGKKPSRPERETAPTPGADATAPLRESSGPPVPGVDPPASPPTGVDDSTST